MSFPTTPPVNHHPRPWAFPTTVRATLPWGLRLVVVRAAALPLVQVRWTFAGGRVQEPDNLLGSSRLLSAVARHGTARWDSAGLAHALDFLGARLRVSVAQDQAGVSASGLSWQLDQLLDLCDEVAFRPTFPEEDLAREKASALEVHEHERMQPEQLSALWLAWVMHQGHPYGRPPASAAGLARTSRQDLVELHRKLFCPARAQLVIVGDVDPDALLASLAQRYATAPADGPALDHVPAMPGLGARRVIAVDRPGAEQIAVAVGHPMMARANTDYLPMRLVNQVFGAGAASRLFIELRERRSLTYGAYSALDGGVVGGDFVANLACSPSKAAEAVSVLIAELERVAAEPIEEDELEPARRYMIGSFPQKASGVGGLAGLIGYGWVHGLPDDTWSRYITDVAAVDAAAAFGAVKRWMSAAQASVVVVGPIEQAREAVAAMGDVELCKAEGAPFDPGPAAA